MNVFVTEFYKNLLRETGASFIFGTATAAARGVLWNDSNLVAKQAQALRRGTEYAQYTMVYNALVYALTKMRIRAGYAAAVGFFVSSYLSGRRNGVAFGIKNGLLGLLMSMAGRMFG